jgi:hypothetical protein
MFNNHGSQRAYTTTTDPRSQRNRASRRGRPDNNSSSQLIRYFGLPAVRAPDTPIPVARCYLIKGPRETPIGVPSLYMPDNNLIEQDHRSIKLRLSPMLGFKRFRHAAITIAGVELMHRIRKGQFALSKVRADGKTAPEIWNAVLAA